MCSEWSWIDCAISGIHVDDVECYETWYIESDRIIFRSFFDNSVDYTHLSILDRIFVLVTGIWRTSLVISLSTWNGTSGLRRSSRNVVNTAKKIRIFLADICRLRFHFIYHFPGWNSTLYLLNARESNEFGRVVPSFLRYFSNWIDYFESQYSLSNHSIPFFRSFYASKFFAAHHSLHWWRIVFLVIFAHLNRHSQVST